MNAHDAERRRSVGTDTGSNSGRKDSGRIGPSHALRFAQKPHETSEHEEASPERPQCHRRTTNRVFAHGRSILRTESNLALAECVRRCCKAFTLFHFFCRNAFTICAWSRRTLSSMVRQSTASDAELVFRIAPACAVICQFTKFSRDRKPRGSLPACASDNVAIRIPGHCRTFALSSILCLQVWLVGPYEEQCLQGPVSFIGKRR
jgi:hypothetical protein